MGKTRPSPCPGDAFRPEDVKREPKIEGGREGSQKTVLAMLRNGGGGKGGGQQG